MDHFRDPYGAEIKNGFSVPGYRDPYGVIVSSTTGVALIRPPRHATGKGKLPTVYCLLFTIRYWLFAIRYTLFTIHCSLNTAATPGSTFPSKYSSSAPPPVET